MKTNTRKCLVCKKKFEVKSNSHWICSLECAKVKNNEAVEKKKEQLKKSDWTKEKSEVKESLKTHSDYLKILQAVFNTYIRVRDKNKPCVSCDKPAGQYTLTAGHFWTAGNYSFLRFNEDNVHGQCWFNCNKNKHGNVGEYRIRLVERIGAERLKFLDENREKELKLSIPEIKELITHYKQKIKQAA